MRRDNMLILSIVFSLALVLSCQAQGLPDASNAGGRTLEPAQRTPPAAPEGVLKGPDVNNEAAEEEDLEGLKDPFVPSFPAPAVEEAAEEAFVGAPPRAALDTSAFNVTGLVWGTLAPKAIIDGDVYGIGDVIRGKEAKIVQIDKEGILFEFQGQKYLWKRLAAES